MSSQHTAGLSSPPLQPTLVADRDLFCLCTKCISTENCDLCLECNKIQFLTNISICLKKILNCFLKDSLSPTQETRPGVKQRSLSKLLFLTSEVLGGKGSLQGSFCLSAVADTVGRPMWHVLPKAQGELPKKGTVFSTHSCCESCTTLGPSETRHLEEDSMG